MEEILTELANAVDAVIERVPQQLPAGFPDTISNAILEGLKALSARLTRAGNKSVICGVAAQNSQASSKKLI
jgi:hypothetical protein